MRNDILSGQAFASVRGRGVACPGTALPGGVTTPLVRNSGVYAAAPPSAPVTVTAAAHLTTFMNNQDKTRTSAAGSGASGSPPTWDPV